jgi:hypothetical protein
VLLAARAGRVPQQIVARIPGLRRIRVAAQ